MSWFVVMPKDYDHYRDATPDEFIAVRELAEREARGCVAKQPNRTWCVYELVPRLELTSVTTVTEVQL